MTWDEESNCWFPHLSPDGKQVVYIAYKKGDVAPGDHPPCKHVQIRLMDADGEQYPDPGAALRRPGHPQRE